jgi:hypothetical protein
MPPSDTLANADVAKNAEIVVSCYDNWDYPKYGQTLVLRDILRRSTPGGSGVWDGVAFTRGEFGQPDWHLILNSIHWNEKRVKFQGRPNRTMFAIGEPPTEIHRPWHEAQVDGSIVLTCDESLSDNPPARRHYITQPPCMGSWSVQKSYDELKSQSPIEKSRNLSWVCSEEAILEGHNYRLDFLNKLKAEIEFDHFGRGFYPVDDKWGALAPYRYSIAFENSCYDYYFSEKLFDCYVAETMPIYYGSKIITQFVPAESLIILDPEDPDAPRIIEDISKSGIWKKNRDAVLEAKRLVLDEYNMFARIAKFMKNFDEPAMPLQNIIINQKKLEYSKPRPRFRLPYFSRNSDINSID